MQTGKEKNTPISPHIEDTYAYMKKRIGLEKSYDLGYRELVVLDRRVQLYYVTGLTDTSVVQEVLKVMIEVNDNESESDRLGEIVENRLVHQQVTPVKTMDEAVDQVLSGLIAVFIDGKNYAQIVDVRNYPGRTPEEPDTEKVIRGSRDGYTENIVENTALTRRRLRDENLRNEMLKVGERSKTDVCITYIEDVANPNLVKFLKDKIESIQVDGMSMSDKSLEEFLMIRKWNIYPLVRYTERPDVATSHLLEGHVILFVDTSPSAIIVPTTFFHHLQHAEEYRQAPSIGTFIRFIRFLAVFAALFLLPTWLLFAMEPSLLPQNLSFIGPNDEGNVPVAIQIILAGVGIEFLRMAAIHTPTPLSTAMGLIAAVLIGEIAIEVGLFSPEVILYVSTSAIGNYVTPSYELSVANKVITLFLVLMVELFGLPGYMIGITLYILFMVQIRSLRTPYMWPLLPFNFKAMKHVLFRIPVPNSKHRPSIVHPRNNYRRP
ncbi:spore germination protein [Oceanobacillus sp. J11TS1]|uniref:spore germination protein n=1 Tax=Oceanobacillus sp. J11TS1 TaxID=2807191 RepID=UPI001B054747|nr:spore germination protein [Oceanobacillus sp. J11TS1]GIO22577.1 stage V sporulation protein AF [Oceanobacillus sp. J11TS1]